MFFRISPKSNIDDTKVRLRCQCGTEWSPMVSKSCPTCGATSPVAMAIDGITWKTMAEHKIDAIRQRLEPGALDEVPEEHREEIRQMIRDQLAKLESGGADAGPATDH